MNPCAAVFKLDGSSIKPCRIAPALCNGDSRVLDSSKLGPGPEFSPATSTVETNYVLQHPLLTGTQPQPRDSLLWSFASLAAVDAASIYAASVYRPVSSALQPTAALRQPSFSQKSSQHRHRSPRNAIAYQKQRYETGVTSWQLVFTRKQLVYQLTLLRPHRVACQLEFHVATELAAWELKRLGPITIDKFAQQPNRRAPPKAPIEPASFRRRQANRTGYDGRRGVASADTPLWSHSRRWTSGEKKELMAYQKMRQNIHYIGADGSPFVPQNAAELAALKITMAEERQRIIAVKVERLTAELSKYGKITPKIPINGHSLFALEDSCFASGEDRVNGATWPTIVQLKEEGDRRAEGTRRLPHPEKVYGWSQQGKMRVDPDGLSFGIRPVDGLAREGDCEGPALDEKDLPDWLGELIDL